MEVHDKARTGRAKANTPGHASVDMAVVGISGLRQSASAAVAADGQLRAFCEQERITRVRRVALEPGRLPAEAVAQVLTTAELDTADIHTYVSADNGIVLPSSIPHTRVAHHFAHAATAFFTSPFYEAVVLVCDHHSDPPVTVWSADINELVDQQWSWRGEGFASLYSEFSSCLGYAGQEHRVEALARLGKEDGGRFARFIEYRDGSLRVNDRWKEFVRSEVRAGSPTVAMSDLAADFQSCLGRCLLEFVRDVRRQLGKVNLCLAGGLFYNTYFATLLAMSELFEGVFVPPNPGNPGAAAGAALALSRPGPSPWRGAAPLFLGPSYSDHEIKLILDNCKLTYEYVNEGVLIDTVVGALKRGLLVGWFQGRMEWGHKALGSRSILASPFSPHVLENLNVFLKQREPFRPYGLSVCEEECAAMFEGPRQSRAMEFEYRPRDPEQLRHVLQAGASTLRVQTIDDEPGLFRTLHKAFASAAGCGALVNTSFNGFSEPIVCSPRDAIRVFFGTGIDLLVMGRFIINK